MPGCCHCIPACKPHYKRLVDSIFPVNPEDELVRSQMEKLTFYAVSHNEKLDRIGTYLCKRLSRDVYRNKIGHVIIAMQALDELLLACHAQSLNLFVESFLKMVSKLLESNNTDLQILGGSSFVKFSNIEEDTPSYHRRYDFFVSKFSSMCHNNSDNLTHRRRIRVTGLKGLQGVVRKTVTDDLQVNIWDKAHMDKIIPSFLFNMQEAFERHDSPAQELSEERPHVLAETCLRDVMCRAAYGNIHSVLKPVLRHMDLHELWVPNTFAVKVFKVIVYSIQSQYLYVAPHFLLLHLDENAKSSPVMKTSIVEVLKATVAVAADGAVGPSILEVFNTLLRHLRLSVDQRMSGGNQSVISVSSKQTLDRQGYNENEEIVFEEAIIDTIGAFAMILPDYQKIEIMMFIMGKVPSPKFNEDMDDAAVVQPCNGIGDQLLQSMLLKSLLEVGNKYTTGNMAVTFPASFFQPLLNMSLVTDPGIRLIVQQILQTLIDRHDNVDKLLGNRPIPDDIKNLGLKVEKTSRQDTMFMRKNGSDIYWHFYENMSQSSNTVEHFEAMYCTLALLLIELGGDDIVVDLIGLALGLQDLACSDVKLPASHRCCIHALVARYLHLIAELSAIPALRQHVRAVSKDIELKGRTLELRIRSATDPGSVILEMESVNNSPAGTRKHPEEQITYDVLKKTLTDVDNDEGIESAIEKRRDILERFQNNTLEVLASSAEQRVTRVASWQPSQTGPCHALPSTIHSCLRDEISRAVCVLIIGINMRYWLWIFANNSRNKWHVTRT
ncbi:protein EFR3 homolog B-like [Anneissia japonica]|uniref:protein EFR3 homolog B-like n=1 Tax=Anneissia japonica TaxID=1529436 RepID=UPI0014257735|nr:protein EFR3 homolog B-like [Anneissia japonica]